MPSPSLIVLTVASFFASMSVSVPPFSDGTYAREPSGRNAIERGRGPTLTDFTTLCAARSMTKTAPSSSDVTQTRLPSGCDRDALRLVADLERVDDLAGRGVDRCSTCPASSLATNTLRAVVADRELLGIGAALAAP